MVDTINPSLCERPKPFDCIRVHVPADVDMFVVPNNFMVISVVLKMIVTTRKCNRKKSCKLPVDFTGKTAELINE